MSESIRERLISAILTATGGQYAPGSADEASEAPVTYVQDDTDQAGGTYDVTECVMPVSVARIEVSASPDRNLQRKQAHAALAGLITSMFADETFGGLAKGIEYAGGGIQIDAAKLVFAEASFRVRYEHLRGQPTVSS